MCCCLMRARWPCAAVSAACCAVRRCSLCRPRDKSSPSAHPCCAHPHPRPLNLFPHHPIPIPCVLAGDKIAHTRAVGFVRDRETVKKLFNTLGPRYKCVAPALAAPCLLCSAGVTCWAHWLLFVGWAVTRLRLEPQPLHLSPLSIPPALPVPSPRPCLQGPRGRLRARAARRLPHRRPRANGHSRVRGPAGRSAASSPGCAQAQPRPTAHPAVPAHARQEERGGCCCRSRCCRWGRCRWQASAAIAA